MPEEANYRVQKIVAGVAILANKSKQRVCVPLNRLRGRVTEGATLRVQLDNHGTPNWYSAEIDNTKSGGQPITQAPEGMQEERSGEDRDAK